MKEYYNFNTIYSFLIVQMNYNGKQAQIFFNQVDRVLQETEYYYEKESSLKFLGSDGVKLEGKRTTQI